MEVEEEAAVLNCCGADVAVLSDSENEIHTSQQSRKHNFCRLLSLTTHAVVDERGDTFCCSRSHSSFVPRHIFQ